MNNRELRYFLQGVVRGGGGRRLHIFFPSGAVEHIIKGTNKEGFKVLLGMGCWEERGDGDEGILDWVVQGDKMDIAYGTLLMSFSGHFIQDDTERWAGY